MLKRFFFMFFCIFGVGFISCCVISQYLVSPIDVDFHVNMWSGVVQYGVLGDDVKFSKKISSPRSCSSAGILIFGFK